MPGCHSFHIIQFCLATEKIPICLLQTQTFQRMGSQTVDHSRVQLNLGKMLNRIWIQHEQTTEMLSLKPLGMWRSDKQCKEGWKEAKNREIDSYKFTCNEFKSLILRDVQESSYHLQEIRTSAQVTHTKQLQNITVSPSKSCSVPVLSAQHLLNANFASITYKMGFISYLNLPKSHASVIMQKIMLSMWSSLFHVLWKNRAARGEGEGEVNVQWELLCENFSAKHSTECLWILPLLDKHAWQAQHSLNLKQTQFPLWSSSAIPAQHLPAVGCNDGYHQLRNQMLYHMNLLLLPSSTETVCAQTINTPLNYTVNRNTCLFSFLPPLPSSSFELFHFNPTKG